MAFAGLKTLDEILASKKEIKFGATGPGANTDDIPKLMNALVGTKFKVVPGYKGSADIRLAMKRKEVDAICITWDSMRATARADLDAKGDEKMIPFIFQGMSTDPEVKDLPQFAKVFKGEDNIAAWKAYANPMEMQRPLMVPPKTPKDRLNVLRRAFDKSIQDPELLAEAKKSKLLIEPVSGEEVEKLVDEILAMSPGAKEKLSLLIKPEK
jgi:tripartite-type tricarboxylate transporter receptor subunit TctC